MTRYAVIADQAIVRTMDVGLPAEEIEIPTNDEGQPLWLPIERDETLPEDYNPVFHDLEWQLTIEPAAQGHAEQNPKPARVLEQQLCSNRPIEESAQDLRTKVEDLKDAALEEGFEHNGARFQARDRDLVYTSGLVQLASLAKAANEPFQKERITADNRTITLDADEMIALGVATAAFVERVVNAARTLKDQITTLEEGNDREGLMNLTLELGPEARANAAQNAEEDNTDD